MKLLKKVMLWLLAGASFAHLSVASASEPKLGDKGPAVRELQEQLRMQGYLPKDHVLTNEFGLKTLKALKAKKEATQKIVPKRDLPRPAPAPKAPMPSTSASPQTVARIATGAIFTAKREVVKMISVIRPSRDITVTLGTSFGYHDKEDNGHGSPFVNGCNTNNPYVVGVALPENVLCAKFHVPHIPRKWEFPRTKAGRKAWRLAVQEVYCKWSVVRDARVDLFCPFTGKVISPQNKIVDIGPGHGPQAKGVGIDLTHRLAAMAKINGKGPVAYRFSTGAQQSHKLLAWQQ